MKTYWNANLSPIKGASDLLPSNGGIAIVGGGISGVSLAYFLLCQGERDISIIDCGTSNASYFRNAGHILHGASESYKAMIGIHGREKAKEIFSLSERFCTQIKNTIDDLIIDCDYLQGNYLTIAADQMEEQELEESYRLLKEDGLDYTSLTREIGKFGFKRQSLAKICKLSAQANPVKFRDRLLQYITSQGVRYYHREVLDVDGDLTQATIHYVDSTSSVHDAIIIAANAYSPLISKFVKDRELILPFKGQVQVSQPLPINLPRMHFSTDHGYVYGTVTSDHRLLIGGWRNNVPGQEVGTYSLESNQLIRQGLVGVVEELFELRNLNWEYEWTGIMGSSKTGLPFVGPTSTPSIFLCAGCSGYGFGWFHGCAKLLVDIMFGNNLMKGYEHLNPTS